MKLTVCIFLDEKGRAVNGMSRTTELSIIEEHRTSSWLSLTTFLMVINAYGDGTWTQLDPHTWHAVNGDLRT